uniref:Uncharacterized protein n=1 Tax=Leishmania guyanensis TaxID=5670 RepID=A0A1E1J1F6_LEIGU|nr:Hypothetical protein BN36_2640570 [Leishmania guyanensis]CCM16577.1 Hypothetical protein BN36_2640810 [Leishmania guyanensis]
MTFRMPVCSQRYIRVAPTQIHPPTHPHPHTQHVGASRFFFASISSFLFTCCMCRCAEMNAHRPPARAGEGDECPSRAITHVLTQGYMNGVLDMCSMERRAACKGH